MDLGTINKARSLESLSVDLLKTSKSCDRLKKHMIFYKICILFRRVQIRGDNGGELKDGEGVPEGDEETPERVGELKETSAERKEPGSEKPVRSYRKNCQE